MLSFLLTFFNSNCSDKAKDLNQYREKVKQTTGKIRCCLVARNTILFWDCLRMTVWCLSRKEIATTSRRASSSTLEGCEMVTGILIDLEEIGQSNANCIQVNHCCRRRSSQISPSSNQTTSNTCALGGTRRKEE